MPFRPNYRGDRLERDRAARARTEEKRRRGTRKAQNAKLNAPKPKVHWMTNRLNMQADPRQKACPRTDYLRNYYLAADDLDFRARLVVS